MSSQAMKFDPLPVLIVEDSPVQARTLRFQLEKLNCVITVVDTVARAFDEITLLRPKLVIVDLHLDGELGWPLVERSRRSRDPLVVVISASEDPADVHRARMNNAQHILKPARDDQLRLMVGAARDHSHRQGRRADDRR